MPSLRRIHQQQNYLPLQPPHSLWYSNGEINKALCYFYEYICLFLQYKKLFSTFDTSFNVAGTISHRWVTMVYCLRSHLQSPILRIILLCKLWLIGKLHTKRPPQSRYQTWAISLRDQCVFHSSIWFELLML